MKKHPLKLDLGDLLRIGGLVILAFMYLSPGGGLLLSGEKDRVMSDGSDPATLPYSYGVIINHFKHKPSNLLFGAVPTDRLNPPEGFAIWCTWLEKAVVSFGSMLFPVEQLSTLFVWVILSLTAISFYLLGRVLDWSRPLATALAMCWAFNAYTRARSKVHMALAGLYHLPLVFIGLYLIRERRDRRSLVVASLCFLGVVTTAHYYLIITAFLTPFLLAFLFITPEARSDAKPILGRATLAALPAIFFLGWSYLKPIPAEYVKPGTIAHIKTGETKNGEIHPFMFQFAASPIDYFTGEIAIGTSDLNIVRGALSESVVKNIGNSNTHERSNGIRWLLLFGLGCAVWFLGQKEKRDALPSGLRVEVYFFLLIGLFSFWLSLSPSVFGLNFGPSLWLAKLVSQFRVPSRVGVFVQFSVIMVVGLMLQHWLKVSAKNLGTAPSRKGKKSQTPAPARGAANNFKKFLSTAGVLPILALIELPPFLNDMPISKVVPARHELVFTDKCGMGLYFPYVSGTWGLLEYYYFLQSMRGSPCLIGNAVTETANDRNQLLMKTMPLHPKLFEAIQTNQPNLKATLVNLANCVPLEWLVFDPKVPESWAADVCATLGWEKVNQDTCRSREHGRAVMRAPENCFQR